MPQYILLLILSTFTAGVILPENPGQIIAPLSGYLVVTTIPYIGLMLVLFLQRRGGQHKLRWQTLATAATWTIVMLIFVHQQIHTRNTDGVLRYANDSVVQSVEAAKVLLHGHNPYDTDYSHTLFGEFPSPTRDGGPNVAAQHYAYQPFAFLIYVPFVFVQQFIQLRIDFQSISLLWFFCIIGLLAFRQNWKSRMYLVIFTLAQPTLWIYSIAGFNDWTMILLIICSAMAVQYRRPVLAGLFFGLALATKQTAWILVPLWLWWGMSVWPYTTNQGKKFLSTVIGITAMVILPFVLWNPVAWWSDVVVYVSGVIPRTFPISGITLGQFLRYLPGWENPWRPGSLWPIQLAALLPTGLMLYRWLRRGITTDRILIAGSCILLVVTLTNRVGAPNYFLAPVMLGLAAFMMQQQRTTNTHE